MENSNVSPKLLPIFRQTNWFCCMVLIFGLGNILLSQFMDVTVGGCFVQERKILIHVPRETAEKLLTNNQDGRSRIDNEIRGIS